MAKVERTLPTKVKVKVTQLRLTLCNPIYYTVHGILQARILEWVAFPFSRGSSQPRDRTQVSRIAGGFFTSWATGLFWERAKIQILKRPNSKAITPAERCNTFKAGFQEVSRRKEAETKFGEFLPICSTGAQSDVGQWFRLSSAFEGWSRKWTCTSPAPPL